MWQYYCIKHDNNTFDFVEEYSVLRVIKRLFHVSSENILMYVEIAIRLKWSLKRLFIGRKKQLTKKCWEEEGYKLIAKRKNCSYVDVSLVK